MTAPGPDAPAPFVRGRWRSVVPTLATILAVAVCVTAGNWQRGRMVQKEALAAQLEAAAQAAPVPLPAGVADWSAWRYRPVELEGRFDAARQILIDNRVHAGRPGYHVVTPLVLADGRAVLVNRGFMPAGPRRAERPVAAPPEGQVRIRGRLNVPAAGYVELKALPPVGNVWQNLDPGRFAAATGLPVPAIVVEATGGADDGLVRDWPRPDTGVEKHRIYMLQWYAFAALAGGLWAWFTFRRVARR